MVSLKNSPARFRPTVSLYITLLTLIYKIRLSGSVISYLIYLVISYNRQLILVVIQVLK
jgi:hypothetical protein